MAKKVSISLFQAVEAVMEQVQAPIAIDEVARRVLGIYPSRAKNPLPSIRSHLRTDHVGKTLLFVDRQTVVPLHVAMTGVRFRATLCPEEVDHGVLLIYPAFHCLRPQELEPQDLRFWDVSGEPIATQAAVVQLGGEDPFGASSHESPVFKLGDWFRRHPVQPDDSILITIDDWRNGHYRLEHEAVHQRRESDIQHQNQELADALFNLLETARRDEIFTHLAIATAYSRLSDARGYPGDHWIEVIDADGRMSCNGFAISYADADGESMFDRMFRSLSGERPTRKAPVHDLARERQVYRFKASLTHRAGLWRRLELRGTQTLADLDAVLRGVFQHDRSDHLSGFWKRSRRGAGQRFREIELSTIDPWGKGDGAGQHLAELTLKPGDQLKYVYDFGDWIEHLVTLEATEEPEAGATYPRVVGQNKVRRQYCQPCKANQRKTVATWLCIECSERERRKVLVCEACLTDAHETHDADEIVY